MKAVNAKKNSEIQTLDAQKPTEQVGRKSVQRNR